MSLPWSDQNKYTNERYPAIFDLVSGYLGSEIAIERNINKIDRTSIMLDAIDSMIMDLDVSGSVVNIESKNNFMDINIGLLIGYPLANHFRKQDKKEINKAFANIAEGFSNRVKGEYEYKDRNGISHPIQLTIYPCQNKNQPDGFTVVCRDISMRKNSDSRFYNLLESAPDAIIIIDQNGTIVTVNEQCTLLFGYEKNELIGHKIEMLLPEHLRDAHEGMREGYLDNPQGRLMSKSPNLMGRHKSGQLKSVEISLSSFSQDNGIQTIAIVRDVSYRRVREDEFTRLGFATDHSPDPVIEVDASGRVLYSNKIAAVLSFDDTGSDAYKNVIEQYKNTHGNEHTPHILPRNLELGGRIYRQQVRHAQGMDSYFVYFRDITESQNISQKLGIKEKTDSLTGLSNRIAYIASVKDAINRSNILDVSHTILYINLNDFIASNDNVLADSKYHAAFLRMVARLLKDNIRQADTLARLENGKFAVLLEYCPVSKGFQVAEKIKAMLNGARLDWLEKDNTLTVSIGVVEVAKSFDSYNEILASAEAACLSAKENSNNSIYLYNKKSQMLRIRDNVVG